MGAKPIISSQATTATPAGFAASPPENEAMVGADAVRDLFNAKAPGWRRKYDVDGPLARRIAEFEARLARRTAPPARVLEIGCGTGNLAFHLSGRGYRVHA